MRILGIESSCDESAAAYLEVKAGRIVRFEPLVATQAIHEKYGGVVPEVAAREHSVTLPILLAGLAKKVVGKEDGRALGRIVDAVAATRGPGLVTSLKVGYDTARTLALAWGKKLVGVNHIEGHIYSAWLPGAPLEPAIRDGKGVFPALVLVVSGGHTELLLMKGHGKYRLLGATRDDAAGEAFDKAAKLMGLGYPGGPAISRLAAEGNPAAFDFPRPFMRDPHLEFSFSGLKTAVRYFLQKEKDKLADPKFSRDVAASVEQAIVDVLVEKTVRAAAATKVKSVILAGGVAANGKLRRTLAARIVERLPRVRFVEPPLAYCTDNAAMIALAGYFRARARAFDAPMRADVDPAWELGRQRRQTTDDR
ncbi:MAG TPA: tRNA (adenosine(37)-N6)-threonylcarbamoyltransferase complex transferase subunit TsaD [Patescibacteria group bacterium]|nr:tRNA (adenosine(37)-N6)-threonylcarbamoyltransferase complex transferase subunit TsaD [Patescibacteria group bacterium]